jgi:hypothetical protein
MSVTVIYREDGGVVLDAEGIVTGEQLFECNRTIYATDEKSAKLKYQICDFTKAVKFEISTSELRGIASQDQKAAALNPNMPIVIVGAEDLFYGLAWMWEVYVSEAPFETAVFRELEEAEAWLESELQKRPS